MGDPQPLKYTSSLGQRWKWGQNRLCANLIKGFGSIGDAHLEIVRIFKKYKNKFWLYYNVQPKFPMWLTTGATICSLIYSLCYVLILFFFFQIFSFLKNVWAISMLQSKAPASSITWISKNILSGAILENKMADGSCPLFGSPSGIWVFCDSPHTIISILWDTVTGSQVLKVPNGSQRSGTLR